jgi:3-methyl-2-oxobutanoate hydroxymethyltransferase
MVGQKITIPRLWEKKEKGEVIICTSCYDYPTGLLLDRAGVDVVMVGDSVGMVVLGYENTVPVTMEEIVHHAKAVVRGCKGPFIIGDMPFGSYNSSREKAVENATRLMKEAGVDGVKVEGSDITVVETVRAIVKAGIPVMGHIGVTPQTVSQLGGYKARGKGAAEAKALIDGALALEGAGAFAIELECIPVPVSKIISERLRVPTIGFGAGPYCDGQGLIFYDLLGLYDRPMPKLSKRYVNLSEIIVNAVQTYALEVREGKFPGPENSFSMPEEELTVLKEQLK